MKYYIISKLLYRTKYEFNGQFRPFQESYKANNDNNKTTLQVLKKTGFSFQDGKIKYSQNHLFGSLQNISAPVGLFEKTKATLFYYQSTIPHLFDHILGQY